MKYLKILFSTVAVSAMVGCSSMDVDDTEALSGNFPSDFDDATYMSLHPELVRLQIKDYVSNYNAKLADSASAAGTEAQAAFEAAVSEDSLAFASLDTSVLRSIMLDSQLGGYTQADWELDWAGGTKDTTIITTLRDTVSLSVGDSAVYIGLVVLEVCKSYIIEDKR